MKTIFHKIRKIGFSKWLQELTFTRLFFDTLTSKKTYKSWDEFKHGLFIFSIPFLILLVIWIYSGFTTNLNRIFDILENLFVLFFVIILLRCFLHKKFGILNEGEFIFHIFTLVISVAAFFLFIHIASTVYGMGFFFSIFPAIPATLLFTFIIYWVGGHLILGDFD